MLVVGGPFGPELSSERVVAAIDRGLQAGRLPPADLCPLAPAEAGSEDIRGVLDALGLDARMHCSRAVVIAVEHLALTAAPAQRSPLRGGDHESPPRGTAGESPLRGTAGESPLRGMAFEVATRARQGGVPAYAIAGISSLDAFDARILDLQEILLADSTRALTRAGKRLAGII